MGSVRLCAGEAPPLVDPQGGMVEVTSAYESLRGLLRERPDWSDDEAIARLEDLAHTALGFARGLRRRQAHNDQHRHPARAAHALAAGMLAGLSS
jgi:hypothetical protein